LLDLWRLGGVARRSKIHEGYSPSSRLAPAPNLQATHPFPIYEMGFQPNSPELEGFRQKFKKKSILGGLGDSFP
jgi:hypothetical protein